MRVKRWNVRVCPHGAGGGAEAPGEATVEVGTFGTGRGGFGFGLVVYGIRSRAARMG